MPTRHPEKVQHKAVSMLYSSQTEMHTEDATAISVPIAYRSRWCSITCRTICMPYHGTNGLQSEVAQLVWPFPLLCNADCQERVGLHHSILTTHRYFYNSTCEEKLSYSLR